MVIGSGGVWVSESNHEPWCRLEYLKSCTCGAESPDYQVLLERAQACVGVGWAPILQRLVARLEELGWDGCLAQVKEKFGGLRFYIGSGSEEINAAIDAAEDESFRTCELCGEPGKPRGPGWIKTLCGTCDGAQRSWR